jgi:hypothetical protein
MNQTIAYETTRCTCPDAATDPDTAADAATATRSGRLSK